MADMAPLPQSAPGFKAFDNSIDFAPFIGFQQENAWAFRKSLLFNRAKIFYSLIPKNACTSLLSALAADDGLTSKWFHSHNRIHNVQSKYWAFRDVENFHDDSFKIIAFRNPFLRAMSALNNKLVGTDSEHLVHQRFFESRLNKKIAECRLSEIFEVADRCPHWILDEHFAPQWSFLFYDRYDLVIDADQKIERVDVGGREIELAHQNKKAKPQSREDIGDATIADIRHFIKETGLQPSMPGMHAIFLKTVRSGGNYERDYKLYGELR